MTLGCTVAGRAKSDASCGTSFSEASPDVTARLICRQLNRPHPPQPLPPLPPPRPEGGVGVVAVEAVYFTEKLEVEPESVRPEIVAMIDPD